MEPSGVVIVNKPEGLTSHDIVNRIRRLYGTKRVGHTGTLDPLATGVLVVMIGRAAKAAEYLSVDEKAYIATLRLGLTSDTEDITGEILTKSDAIPSAREVMQVVKSFEGSILQIPPMYSALKIDGQKLCDLARRGVTVERKARPVTIFSIEATPTDTVTDYILKVRCSSGTYIRTLCADIGAKLGCGGVMATLCRSGAGGFSLDGAVTIEQIETLDEAQRIALLRPIESLFPDLVAIKLPAFYEKLSRNGCEIYQSKLRTSLPIGTRVKMYGADSTFYAVGEVREYESGSAIKTIKLFDI